MCEATLAETVKLYDKRELILESFRIEGIDIGQCRSVFLDWVLGMPESPDLKTQTRAFLDFYSPQNIGHPMLEVLSEAESAPTATKTRRGGWRSRPRPDFLTDS